MKIAYFGLPLGALSLAHDGHELGLVVLSPVAAPGRRRLRRLLPARTLVDCTSGVPEARIDERLSELAPDCLLSWFWTRQLPARWLDPPRLGAFGVHPSLLPRHRGPNPYFAAIDAGDSVSGATLHCLGRDYDDGAVVWREAIAVGDLNAWQLARAIDRPSLGLLRRAARSLRAGRMPAGSAQDAAAVTWAGEPEGEQLRVRWEWPTARILRRVRALAPVPGLALNIRGVDFSLLRASATERELLALKPGEAAIVDGRVTICTGDGAIVLEAAELSLGGRTVGQRELARLLEERRLAAKEPRP